MSDHDHHELPPLQSRIIDAAKARCEESRLLVNRRALLGMSASLFSWAYMPRHAEAAGTEPRLIVVVLAGGFDNLHMAPPLHDPRYRSLRGDIALNTDTIARLTDKKGNADFGIHPSMPNFRRMFAQGEAALVQAIAPPLRVGSHFECQYNLESGLPGGIVRTTRQGWLNKLLQYLPQGSLVKTAGGLQAGGAPLIISGNAQVRSWSLCGWKAPGATNAKLKALYQKTDPVLYRELVQGMSDDTLASSASGQSDPVGTFATSARSAFRVAGQLLNAETGPRIAALGFGGWDCHVDETSVISSQLGELDTCLGELKSMMTPENWSRTVVVCVSEFGRTLKKNGRTGTDHGLGTAALLLGGAVDGGQVHGEWPGLETNRNNLRATSDTRALFKGILADHLGVGAKALATKIFDDSADVLPMRGLIKQVAKPRLSMSMSSSYSGNTIPTGTPTAFENFRRRVPVSG